jgi:hypothetical protein
MRALVKLAPILLSDLFAKHRGDDPRPLHTTVYHFGYDRRREAFFGLRYRSAAGSAGREWHTAPSPIRSWITSCSGTPKHASLRISSSSRSDRRTNSKSKDGMIGGQLIAHRMEVVGADVVTTAAVVHEFEDFADLSAKLATRMLEHIAAGLRRGIR